MEIYQFIIKFQLYFRELPEPLCTFNLYSDFVKAVFLDSSTRLTKMKSTMQRMPEQHYRYVKTNKAVNTLRVYQDPFSSDGTSPQLVSLLHLDWDDLP